MSLSMVSFLKDTPRMDRGELSVDALFIFYVRGIHWIVGA